MPTKALIGVINPDGTGSCITCSWDGMLEYTGAILNTHYKDIAKIKTLMDQGNISELGIDPISKTDYWTNNKKYTNRYITKAYKDDIYRNLDLERLKAKSFSTKDALIDYMKNTGESFNYLFAKDNWTYWTASQKYEDKKEIPTKLVSFLREGLSPDERDACYSANPDILNYK